MTKTKTKTKTNNPPKLNNPTKDFRIIELQFSLDELENNYRKITSLQFVSNYHHISNLLDTLSDPTSILHDPLPLNPLYIYPKTHTSQTQTQTQTQRSLRQGPNNPTTQNYPLESNPYSPLNTPQHKDLAKVFERLTGPSPVQSTSSAFDWLGIHIFGPSTTLSTPQKPLYPFKNENQPQNENHDPPGIPLFHLSPSIPHHTIQNFTNRLEKLKNQFMKLHSLSNLPNFGNTTIPSSNQDTTNTEHPTDESFDFSDTSDDEFEDFGHKTAQPNPIKELGLSSPTPTPTPTPTPHENSSITEINKEQLLDDMLATTLLIKGSTNQISDLLTSEQNMLEESEDAARQALEVVEKELVHLNAKLKQTFETHSGPSFTTYLIILIVFILCILGLSFWNSFTFPIIGAIIDRMHDL